MQESVMQPAVEQSEVQRALLSVTAGDLPPKWMNTQVRAHSDEMHACRFHRLIGSAASTYGLVVLQGREAALPLVVMMIPGLNQQLFQEHQVCSMYHAHSRLYSL